MENRSKILCLVVLLLSVSYAKTDWAHVLSNTGDRNLLEDLEDKNNENSTDSHAIAQSVVHVEFEPMDLSQLTGEAEAKGERIDIDELDIDVPAIHTHSEADDAPESSKLEAHNALFAAEKTVKSHQTEVLPKKLTDSQPSGAHNGDFESYDLPKGISLGFFTETTSLERPTSTESAHQVAPQGIFSEASLGDFGSTFASHTSSPSHKASGVSQLVPADSPLLQSLVGSATSGGQKETTTDPKNKESVVMSSLGDFFRAPKSEPSSSPQSEKTEGPKLVSLFDLFGPSEQRHSVSGAETSPEPATDVTVPTPVQSPPPSPQSETPSPTEPHEQDEVAAVPSAGAKTEKPKLVSLSDLFRESEQKHSVSQAETSPEPVTDVKVPTPVQSPPPSPQSEAPPPQEQDEVAAVPSAGAIDEPEVPPAVQSEPPVLMSLPDKDGPVESPEEALNVEPSVFSPVSDLEEPEATPSFPATTIIVDDSLPSAALEEPASEPVSPVSDLEEPEATSSFPATTTVDDSLPSAALEEPTPESISPVSDLEEPEAVSSFPATTSVDASLPSTALEEPTPEPVHQPSEPDDLQGHEDVEPPAPLPETTKPDETETQPASASEVVDPLVTPRQEIKSSKALVEHILGSGVDTTGIKTGEEAKAQGAAILVETGGSLKLESLQIDFAEDVDVLIKLDGGNLELKNVVIGNTQAPSRRLLGAPKKTTALVIDNGANVMIDNSTFQAATNSMIVVTGESRFECNSCRFLNNEGVSGGAVSIDSSSAQFVSCSFEGNRAANHGGAIFLMSALCSESTSTYLKIVDSKFVGNAAGGAGAGIFVRCAGSVDLVRSAFQNGVAIDGGAVYIDSVDALAINRTAFSNNVAQSSGGSLVLNNAETLSIAHSKFSYNRARGSTGGAASIRDTRDISLLHSDLDYNVAKEGGALLIEVPSVVTGEIHAEDVRFRENKAMKTGGALVIKRKSTQGTASIDSTRVKIYKSNFSGNAASEGGALYVSSELQSKTKFKIEVSDSVFTSNSAGEIGGGVYCGSQSIMEVRMSDFSSNSAEKGTDFGVYCTCSLNVMSSTKIYSDTNSRVEDSCEDNKAVSKMGKKAMDTKVYIYATLGAVCAFIILGGFVVYKKRRAMAEDFQNRITYRSLTTVIGHDGSESDINAHLLPCDGGEGPSTAGPSLLKSNTFGEIDSYVAIGDQEVKDELFDHERYLDDQEATTLQSAISADEAFYDALNWKNQTEGPSVPKLESIPETRRTPSRRKERRGRK